MLTPDRSKVACGDMSPFGAAKLCFESDYDRPRDVGACKRKGSSFARTTAKLCFELVCSQSRVSCCVNAYPEVQQCWLSADRPVSELSFVGKSQIPNLAENICPTGSLLSADQSVSGLSFVVKSQITGFAENGNWLSVNHMARVHCQIGYFFKNRCHLYH